MLVSFADEPGTIARIMLQAALNGDRTKAEHAALPVSVEELALDVAACVAAGARAIHLHPRDSEGRERLDAHVVDEVVVKIREACRVPVGVSTGAWRAGCRYGRLGARPSSLARSFAT
jgi:uncharacterized protein (DUF849 family)